MFVPSQAVFILFIISPITANHSKAGLTMVKVCEGTTDLEENDYDDYKEISFLHEDVKKRYTNCTHVDGNLEIINIKPSTNYELNFLQHIQEVSGYVAMIGIEAKELCLPKLQLIRGQTNKIIIGEMHKGLIVHLSHNQTLNLPALREITYGSVEIEGCGSSNCSYIHSIDWSDILTRGFKDLNTIKIPKDKYPICHSSCEKGCWSNGPENCQKFNKINCSAECNRSRCYGTGPNECCHKFCAAGCTGPTRKDCFACKNFNDNGECKQQCQEKKFAYGPYCVKRCLSEIQDQGGFVDASCRCPPNYYEKKRECLECHRACFSCEGPDNTISTNGCIDCKHKTINGSVQTCSIETTTCADGFFVKFVGPEIEVCDLCHSSCAKCTGPGFHQRDCSECKKYRKGENCVIECASNEYANETNKICEPCHEFCKKCKGAGAHNCLDCKNFKIFHPNVTRDEFNTTTQFNCTAKCSKEFKNYRYLDNSHDSPYCSDEADEYVNHNNNNNNSPLFVFVFVGIILSMVSYFVCKQKSKEKELEALKVLAEMDDTIPLQPSTDSPNVSRLCIIEESEIKRGAILGLGAFGKVYRGVWTPQGKHIRIPVAIKVLINQKDSDSSKEFIDETYIMASVKHPNLLRLLAVCMTTQMMLITQLMPLGCLLDYVRKNRNKIGSKVFLNWLTQIARGMSYLEENRLVHRDLAARNVLVYSPSQVKISDFGLAKLLDGEEVMYHAGYGKVPIKWLAIECIRDRIYTSKSDVWAFGVTIWELLTFGLEPYGEVHPRDIPSLIDAGHKLPQPDICTLDIYCILISCWILNPELRPSFKELAKNFSNKARDPGKYLIIPGDELMRFPMDTVQDEEEVANKYIVPVEGYSDSLTYSKTQGDNNLNPNELSKETECGQKIDSMKASFSDDLPLYKDKYFTSNCPISLNLITYAGYIDMTKGVLKQTIDNPVISQTCDYQNSNDQYDKILQCNQDLLIDEENETVV